MSSRRDFLVSAPLGLAGVLAACNPNDFTSAAQAATSAPVGGNPPTPLAAVPGDAPVLRYIPTHDELVYTFGGAPARHRIASGTRIISWTEDCFDGAVKTAKDLPSKVMTAGHDHPQTGPFHIDGAAPGDTIAMHIVKLAPSRSYAVSSFGPGFGALVGNNETAMLGPDFPETTWRYDVDVARNVARSTSSDGKQH